MNRTDVIWALGRPTIGGAVRLVAPLRVYGAERGGSATRTSMGTSLKVI